MVQYIQEIILSLIPNVTKKKTHYRPLLTSTLSIENKW